MTLFAHLALRLMAVVLLCLGCAVGWVLVDTHRSIEAETAASADRVARALEILYWRELLWHGSLRHEDLLPLPEWETLNTLRVISPGICIGFAPNGASPRTLCSQLETAGRLAPAWFGRAFGAMFGPMPRVERPLSLRRRDAGSISAQADSGAGLRQAWQRITMVVGVAVLLAGAIGLLAALSIGHSLLPARTIVAGLQRLERGDYDHRLSCCATTEFSLIVQAVNDLAGRLAESKAVRAQLTHRLFQVQEEERRALARDLHDEFGQCLAAVGALAAAIEAGAGPGRPDLAEDARSVAAIRNRMAGTLRSALRRLRSQEVEEIGLEASLAQLVAGWNLQAAAPGVFHLDVDGDLADLPQVIALNIYRIAQECLTNAARHGKPRHVQLQVERVRAEVGDSIVLRVEDDGGGSPRQLSSAAGFGVLGIRERVAALGGSLSIREAKRGVCVAARIPLDSPLAGLATASLAL